MSWFLLTKRSHRLLAEDLHPHATIQNLDPKTRHILHPQLVQDAHTSQIEVYPPNLVSAIPLIKTGRLRALAVTSAKRASSLPDLPSVSETVPGYDATTGVYGILVPLKTPRKIVDLLYREIAAVARTDRFKREIEIRGGEVVGSTPREYEDYLNQQKVKLSRLFKQLGIKPQ